MTCVAIENSSYKDMESEVRGKVKKANIAKGFLNNAMQGNKHINTERNGIIYKTVTRSINDSRKKTLYTSDTELVGNVGDENIKKDNRKHAKGTNEKRRDHEEVQCEEKINKRL